MDPVDWNEDDVINRTATVQANINCFPQLEYNSPPGENLKGRDDWDNLVFVFRNSDNFAYGTHPETMEEELNNETIRIMHETAQQMHETAITDLTFPETTIGQSSPLSVNVTLFNLGENEEIFNFTIFANLKLVASQILTLASGTRTTAVVPCNTPSLAIGSYTLIAHLGSVENETYTADNTVVEGIVQVVGVSTNY